MPRRKKQKSSSSSQPTPPTKRSKPNPLPQPPPKLTPPSASNPKQSKSSTPTSRKPNRSPKSPHASPSAPTRPTPQPRTTPKRASRRPAKYLQAATPPRAPLSRSRRLSSAPSGSGPEPTNRSPQAAATVSKRSRRPPGNPVPSIAPPSPPSPNRRTPSPPRTSPPRTSSPIPPFNPARPPAADLTTGSSYFEAHGGPTRTSNYTLASLNILPPETLQQTLKELPNPLEKQQGLLCENIIATFSKLSYLLSTNQSLLFYGFGSKRTVLEEFAEYHSQYSHVIVVDGFNPTVTLRAVLSEIVSALKLPSTASRRLLLDYVRTISDGTGNGSRMTLVIHNIDGPAFRSKEAQHALSMLGCVEGFCLAASVDHVNAPLLWDGGTYAKFSWAWIKADTLISYSAETVYGSKFLLKGGGERQVEGAVALLKSLSIKARKVFALLAMRQMGEEGEGGVRTTFNELFDRAKEKFFVSEQSSLAQILTELETHQLLEEKRGGDAAILLVIPLGDEQLKEVLKLVEE